MVRSIDIKRLNLDELLGVVSIYPWYAGARVELCSRMAGTGSLSEQQLTEAALYAGSRSILSDMMNGGASADYSDSEVERLLKSVIDNSDAAPQEVPEPVSPAEEAQQAARRYFVVGGDYFSTSQYKDVRRAEDNIFSGFASSGKEVEQEYTDDGGFDFYTETLAEIYAEQGYMEEAKEIYYKLSLRYPEKSVYFAALIEKLDKN